MTNAKKFVEVFGTDLKRQYSTKTWWDQEFIPNKAIPTGWIPVSERLPEENKTVIASTKYGVYPEAKYTKRYGWEWAYEAGVDYWEEIKDVVTAWMPLPEKYKPESEEVNK